MKKQLYKTADFWSQKAAKEGYPARSVYKLQEIDEKFKLFSAHSQLKVLDLGAAPGSWSMYVLRKQPAVLVSCDLQAFSLPAADPQTAFCIQGDMTAPEIRDSIMAQGPYTHVICDAAPATSGNRSLDTLRSLALAEMAAWYAEHALIPGGSFVVKLFQGAETAAFIAGLRPLFEAAKTFKPQACRPQSFEMYCVCQGKKAFLAT
jgi:23S rRNA (uridine2552-2'-O)-methyltransferase